MPSQVQFRRGNTNQNNNFIGADGEISINSDNNSIRVHDSVTQGGTELARADLSNTTGVTTITSNLFIGNLTGTATTATKLETIRTFEITGPIVASAQNFDGTQNVSLASSIQPNTVGLGTHTYGDYVKNITGTIGEIEVSVTSGEGVSSQIGLPNDVTIANNLNVNNNVQITHDLNVNGNITIGGTTAFINVDNLLVSDRDIVSGYTVDNNGNDISTDITANSGGIAVASTEGSPLVNLNIVGIETLPPTYKKLMWFKENAFAGLGTDAWMFNYGVGIGSTQIPYGVRLAVGDVQITDQDLIKVRNINASGITTVSSLNSGSINSSGIITGTILSTGLSGIGINTNTIYGPSVIIIDPDTVGDNTGILRIKGDFYVDGTQTIINSTTLEVADLQISIGTTAFNDVVLDGAGIGIGSITSRKTFTWEYSTSSLKSSENINLNSGKTYKINGIDVLSSNTLGSGVVNSSLTSIGTLNSLNVSGVSTLPNLNSTNITAGVITATTFVGDLSGNSTTATTSTNVIGGISSITTLSVSGVSTLGTVQVSSGIITATTGVVTYYGDGSKLSNIISGVGIQSSGVTVGSGITTLNFIGAGNTFSVSGSTVNISIQGGGGGTSSQWVTTSAGIHTLSNVGIGTTNPIQQFQVGVAGTNSVVVTGIGSVGIGTTNPNTKLHVLGDLNLDDGGTYTTTLQIITPTANRAISLPDATGTVALIAGTSGQLIYNLSGAYSGVVNSGIDTLGNVTLGSRLINSTNGAASAPPVSLTGTWFSGGTSTTTKPQLLVEPSGATSTAWNTNGTGIGINAASGFTGRLLDLQLNGTSNFNVDSTGRLSIPLGTALLPSIYPGTNTNTGFWSPTTNTLAASTNGTEAIRISSTQNVGIKTTNPTSALHIVGDTLVTGIVTATTFSGNLTGTNLNISGISTLGTVRVSSGIVTAVSGIVTYYGDGSVLSKLPTELGFACSDETTDLTTGQGKVTFRMPYPMTVTTVKASVNTAPSGAAIVINIRESGTTIFSTKPQIDSGSLTSIGSTVTPVISDANLANDAEIKIDIDQVGVTTVGKGLKVWIIGTRA